MSSHVGRWLGRALSLLLPLCAFLIGIRGMGLAFKLLGRDALEFFFHVSENPFVGLLIGILSTSIVQSSSVTTSMVVGMVAAPEAALPIASAIPMVMGANIGTTVTNTIVSMGHVARPEEFRRALAAGTCDDFFNLLVVALLLPLERATGMLEWLSGQIVGAIPRSSGRMDNPMATAADFVLDPLRDLSFALWPTAGGGALLFLLLSVATVFSALYVLVGRLRLLAKGRLESSVSAALDASPLVGLIAGALLTALVQSSSLTLSLLVPLAGTGIMTLEQIFPLVLGANFGTTLTAFMASTAVPLQTLHQAVQISLVHMLFNLVGVLLIYPLPKLRALPLSMARAIADIAVRSKLRAALYVVGLFYGLPLLGLVLFRLL
ncbi:MAG: Na/Pi symporter [Myxococcales bacterium]|nr:Na/Pi symporter [Myxococcales bacterium]